MELNKGESMDKKMYRHGDVIIVPVDKIPTEATKREGVTLALGEITGHSHRMADGEVQMFAFDDRTYMQIQSKISALVHEEHHRIDLPAGNYEVIIQREYEPNGWRTVRD